MQAPQDKEHPLPEESFDPLAFAHRRVRDMRIEVGEMQMRLDEQERRTARRERYVEDLQSELLRAYSILFNQLFGSSFEEPPESETSEHGAPDGT